MQNHKELILNTKVKMGISALVLSAISCQVAKNLVANSSATETLVPPTSTPTLIANPSETPITLSINPTLVIPTGTMISPTATATFTEPAIVPSETLSGNEWPTNAQEAANKWGVDVKFVSPLAEESANEPGGQGYHILFTDEKGDYTTGDVKVSADSFASAWLPDDGTGEGRALFMAGTDVQLKDVADVTEYPVKRLMVWCEDESVAQKGAITDMISQHLAEHPDVPFSIFVNGEWVNLSVESIKQLKESTPTTSEWPTNAQEAANKWGVDVKFVSPLAEESANEPGGQGYHILFTDEKGDYTTGDVKVSADSFASAWLPDDGTGEGRALFMAGTDVQLKDVADVTEYPVKRLMVWCEDESVAQKGAITDMISQHLAEHPDVPFAMYVNGKVYNINVDGQK